MALTRTLPTAAIAAASTAAASLKAAPSFGQKWLAPAWSGAKTVTSGTVGFLVNYSLPLVAGMAVGELICRGASYGIGKGVERLPKGFQTRINNAYNNEQIVKARKLANLFRIFNWEVKSPVSTQTFRLQSKDLAVGAVVCLGLAHVVSYALNRFSCLKPLATNSATLVAYVVPSQNGTSGISNAVTKAFSSIRAARA